jgi:hypothetical protein
MKRSRIFSLWACAVLLFSLFAFTSCKEKTDEGATWRSGLFATISLSLRSEEGKISACARNDFTLGFATLPVYVYLYSSEVMASSWESMDEEGGESVKDLNIFHELRVTESVGNVRKYWMARMRYKTTDGWHDVHTAATLF